MVGIKIYFPAYEKIKYIDVAIVILESLWTVVVALVAVRPVAAVDSVLVVAHHLDRLVEGALFTNVVIGIAPDTVPVLDATVGVSIPTVRLVGAI